MTEHRGYEEGVADGKIYQRLEGHDRHFVRINGSLEKVAAELAQQSALLQQIIAGLATRDATVISVAEALEKKEEARRDVSTHRWTPVQRWLTVLATLVAIVGAVVTIIATR